MTPSFLKLINKTWSLFLDRDGVINKQIIGGYVSSPDEFDFLPGVLESFAFFSTLFNKVIIITNQQGVGKGIMSEAELIAVNNYMIKKISEAGGKLDAIYYCTDMAEKIGNCRKPSPSMAQKALLDFPEIDFSKSIMVGDSLCDIEFGQNMGMKTIFSGNNHDSNQAASMADYKVQSLFELMSVLEKLLRT
jgi:histidinol-phosphate phosphatase family protein